MTKTHFHHSICFPNWPINTRREEDSRPAVAPAHPNSQTPFFLRPLMLWKPVNWLLSNCLSFRLRSYLGPSVQTHHLVGGATMNRSKQHICSQVEETRHLSRNVRDTSVGAEALDTLPVLVLSQSNPEVLNLFFCFFLQILIKAASLLLPVLSYKPGGTGM